MATRNSKLAEDEEAMTADDEPMGSVAAAVPRDRGSSAGAMKTEPPKPPVKNEKPKPKKP